MGRIRIAFLIGHLGYGGTERQLYLLLTNLNLERLEPLVVVFNQSPNASFAEELEARGIRIIEIPDTCTGIVRRSFLLLRILRRFQPSIVHSWTIHDNPYAGLVGRIARVPVRWGSARLSLASDSFTALSRLNRWLSVFSVQRNTVNAESLVADLERAGYPSDRIDLIPNCVSSPERLPCADFDFEEYGIGPSDPIVGIVANYRRTKNLTMFIRVMKSVVENCPGTHGVMVGHPVAAEPGMWEEVEREIRSCGLEGRIHMIGFRDDAPSLMALFSMFLLTSTAEGTPNVLLEAMASGVSVVAPAIDGIPTLIQHGSTGFLFPSGDVNTAAKCVVRLLEDQELDSRVSGSAKTYVEAQHQCAEIAAKFEAVYFDAYQSSRR